ncbi:MAG: hypothetical protein DWQ07_17490 [Chloroflexi bacterium]|nr:MAG: hypothetical protein DWQ07_17490 [Chloroflexota bacterium]
MINVDRDFALDNEGHKQEAALAAARVLGDPSDPREVEFFPVLRGVPLPITSVSALKAAIRSTC